MEGLLDKAEIHVVLQKTMKTWRWAQAGGQKNRGGCPAAGRKATLHTSDLMDYNDPIYTPQFALLSE